MEKGCGIGGLSCDIKLELRAQCLRSLIYIHYLKREMNGDESLDWEFRRATLCIVDKTHTAQVELYLARLLDFCWSQRYRTRTTVIHPGIH